jgi:hypothetical protein
MGTNKPSSKALKSVNLEDGMPTVHEALVRLAFELDAARHQGCTLLKLIHGYGSSGAGGEIRMAVQSRLVELQRSGQIRAAIFGENWSKTDKQTWDLVMGRPELKQDIDLGRRNAGITIVVL